MAATDLGKRLEWIIANRGFKTAKALSARAGLGSTAHVGMMVRGEVKTPSADTLAKIAQVAGVDLNWLTTGNGSPISEPTVDRGEADALPLSDDDIPLERAVVDLARDRSYTTGDMDIARKVAREAHRFVGLNADLVEIARAYLNAARALRLEGLRVDVTSVGVRASIMLSGSSVAHVTAASEEANARAKALSDAFDAPPPAKPGKKR
jgi:transcriptional regulator with XRE-family HTH domain